MPPTQAQAHSPVREHTRSQMAEALIAGIAELEAALLEVTRSRLLASMEQVRCCWPSWGSHPQLSTQLRRARVCAHTQGNGVPAGAAVALGPPAGLMPPGTRCRSARWLPRGSCWERPSYATAHTTAAPWVSRRFRGDDGRWYGGVVVELLPPAPPPAGPDTAGGGAPDEHQRQQQDPQEEEGMAAGGARWMAHVAFDMPTHRWVSEWRWVGCSGVRWGPLWVSTSSTP